MSKKDYPHEEFSKDRSTTGGPATSPPPEVQAPGEPAGESPDPATDGITEH